MRLISIILAGERTIACVLRTVFRSCADEEKATQRATPGHWRRPPATRWAAVLAGLVVVLLVLATLVAFVRPLSSLPDVALPSAHEVTSPAAPRTADPDLSNPSPDESAQDAPSPAPTTEPTQPPSTVSPTPTPRPDAVSRSDINLRSGPGTGYGVLKVLSTGDALSVLGKTAAGDWLMVRTADEVDGWVSGDLVALNVERSAIAVAQTPPEPPPAELPPPQQQPAKPTSPAPKAQPQGSASSRGAAPVSVGRVTAVGDSVMLAAVGPLQQAFSNLDLDAVVGRQVPAALDALRSRRAAGQLGDVVVVHMGNNGTFSDKQFDDMMALLADVRRVVIVNVKVPRNWEGPDNAVLASGVQRYPNTVLVDWHAASANRPELFWDDGVHLRPEGVRVYSNLIIGAVRSP